MPKLTVVIQAAEEQVDRLSASYRNLRAAELKHGTALHFLEHTSELTTAEIAKLCAETTSEYILFVTDNHEIPRNFLPTIATYVATRSVYLAEPYFFDVEIPEDVTKTKLDQKYYYKRRTEIYGVCFNRKMLQTLLQAEPQLEISTIYINYRLYWGLLSVKPLPCGYGYNSQTHITNGIRTATVTEKLFFTEMQTSAELQLAILRYLLLHLRFLKAEKSTQVPLAHYKKLLNEYELAQHFSVIALVDRFESLLLRWLHDSKLSAQTFKQLSNGKQHTLHYSTVEDNTVEAIELYQISFANETLTISKSYTQKNFESLSAAEQVAQGSYYDSPVTPDSIILIYDRSDKADDNGEYFYRYLKDNRPEFKNVYFALSKKSKDWNRLEADGFKLVEMFKPEFYKLFMQSDVVLSSQMYSIAHNGKNFTNSRFVYLQHGIQLNDMTDWAVAKFFDVFIVTGEPEANYMSKFAPVETLNTGIPRLETLTRKSDGKHGDLVFMPTWRFNLHNIPDSEFVKSQYFNEIDGILTNQELNIYLEKTGRRLVVKLHPNLEKRAHLFSFSEKVIYSAADYREVIENADFVFTDFSSVICDAAFIGIPVAYYQWDQKHFFDDQAYTNRIDYEKDGIGPVFTNINALLSYITSEKFNAEDAKYTKNKEWFFAGATQADINSRILENVLAL